jgi:hypothetical protein
LALLENPNLVKNFQLKQRRPASNSKTQLSSAAQALKRSISGNSIDSNSSGTSNKSDANSHSAKQTKSNSSAIQAQSKLRNPFSKVSDFLRDYLKPDENDTSARELSRNFTVVCGNNQIRTMYNIQICVLDFDLNVLWVEDSVQRNAIKQTTLQTLYSNALSGLVLYVKKCSLPQYGKSKTENKSIFQLNSIL